MNPDGHRHYPGGHDGREPNERYAHIQAEWPADGGHVPIAQAAITVTETVSDYRRHLEDSYPQGAPRYARDRARQSVRFLVDLYGFTPAAQSDPLRPRIARQQWFDAALARELATGTQVFTVPSRGHVAATNRADLKDARNVWFSKAGAAEQRQEREEPCVLSNTDEAGRVSDSHALRHTIFSNLTRGGAHPKLAQSLARHSTITPTTDRYSQTVIGEQADALNVRPDPRPGNAEPLRATGTLDPTATPPDPRLNPRHSVRETGAKRGDAVR